MSGGTGDANYVRGTSGNDDVKASGGNGSILNTGAGDDILRGGKYDDFLIGGAGNDQMFGGGGADQFRFFANTIEGGIDTDRIYDLKFSEGDSLVFGLFNEGLFTDASGINAFNDGAAAQVSSIEGLRSMVANSNGAITASQRGSTDVLIVTIHNGDDTQILWLSNMWSAYADTAFV